MLTFTFLGVGSAFAKRNYQSNVLVEAWTDGPQTQSKPDDLVLIDFGATGPIALHQLRARPEFAYLNNYGLIDYTTIGRIFITHLHTDHIGGLEELAAMNRHNPNGVHFTPELIAADEVLKNLWDQSLRGGLEALKGFVATLKDYFKPVSIMPADQGGPDHFMLMDRYEFKPIRTDHVRIHRRFDWPTFGLHLTDRQNGNTAVFSGDTRFDLETFGEMLENSGMNFHDVQLENNTDESVHASLEELRALPLAVREKTVLYHYGDTWDSGAYSFVADEFTGFARPQHRYVVFND